MNFISYISYTYLMFDWLSKIKLKYDTCKLISGENGDHLACVH